MMYEHLYVSNIYFIYNSTNILIYKFTGFTIVLGTVSKHYNSHNSSNSTSTSELKDDNTGVVCSHIQGLTFIP